jgi:hypothetical protein
MLHLYVSAEQEISRKNIEEVGIIFEPVMGMKTQSPFAEFLSVTDQNFAHKVEDWLKKLELAPRGKPILKSSCTFCSTQRCAGS